MPHLSILVNQVAKNLHWCHFCQFWLTKLRKNYIATIFCQFWLTKLRENYRTLLPYLSILVNQVTKKLHCYHICQFWLTKLQKNYIATIFTNTFGVICCGKLTTLLPPLPNLGLLSYGNIHMLRNLHYYHLCQCWLITLRKTFMPIITFANFCKTSYGKSILLSLFTHCSKVRKTFIICTFDSNVFTKLRKILSLPHLLKFGLLRNRKLHLLPQAIANFC